MYKEKVYRFTRFSADVLRSALDAFQCCFDLSQERLSQFLSVTIGEAEWGHDSIEEFLSDYRQATGHCYLSVSDRGLEAELRIVLFRDEDTKIMVKGSDRQKIESVFEVFERNAGSSKLTRPPNPPPPSPTIFIGHGRSPHWRDLKDHLHEQHGYEIEAYEIGARAGHYMVGPNVWTTKLKK